jgi:heat shock protein HslJ
MFSSWKREDYHPSPALRAFQVFLLILIILGLALIATQKLWVPKLVERLVKNDTVFVPVVPQHSGYKDSSYTIDGNIVSLVGGVSEVPVVPGSASKVVTQYFGNEVMTDLNGDGRKDVVFLLTQNTGGSGTFYYVVAALDTDKGFIGSQAYLLGDRIAPQTTEVSRDTQRRGVIVVNYADRKAGESFSTPPSVGKSVWLKLDPVTLQFGEVAQNFEGEASPTLMTLPMHSWVWVSATRGNGMQVTPNKPQAFKLTFKKDGTFSASTDCNGVGGEYSTNKSSISFTRMMSTLMYCEGSQESVFADILTTATKYTFTSKGELILHLQDSGTATFKAAQ